MRAIALSTATLLLLVSLVGIASPSQGARLLTHTVQPGENLYRIALRYGVTVDAIKSANGLRSDRILSGQALKIPPETRARVGARMIAPQPLRIRRGPESFFTTLALVAADTPLQIVGEYNGWYQVQLSRKEVGWVEREDLRAGLRPHTPTGSAGTQGGDAARDAVRFLGTPYRWGGQNSRGVDCSGFVYIVFNNRVHGLGRLRSFDYYRVGTAVAASGLAPGDLVFFSTYAAGPSHVGIYVGDGKFIHAASGAGRVMMNSLKDSYYAARYVGARRILRP